MDEVNLVDYDQAWPSMYVAEATRLSATLPRGLVLDMEHFGSTSIPGMIAKPIIDILVAVRSIHEARESAVGPMEALGLPSGLIIRAETACFSSKACHRRHRTGHITFT